MAMGIELPTRAVKGRLKRLGGDEYINQLVQVALGDGDSDNPFQDLGLGEFMIFAINNEQVDGEIKTKVKAVFSSLESDQLARLLDMKIVDEENEKKLFLLYQNLETGGRIELEVPLPNAV